MRIRGLVLLAGVLLAGSGLLGAERVMKLDLMKGTPAGKTPVNLKALPTGEVQWDLPTGEGQAIILDLAAQGIRPADYDELRFEIQPLVSQVGLNVMIANFPAPEQRSSWYLKFRAPTGVWSAGRYDLALDDDGLYIGKADPAVGQRLTITLYPRILGYPGEPPSRQALFRNVRFVKRLVSADFDLMETEVSADAGEVATTYRLHVANLTDQPQNAVLTLDPLHTLKYFAASGPGQLTLKPKEAVTVPIRVFMPTTLAQRLPPLYSEPICPEVSIPGVPDSDVTPLRGYRRFPMWGTVPPFNYRPWTPATFQAFLAAREKALPGIAGWRAGVVARAEGALACRWPVPDFGPPLHDQSYRCNDCRDWLQPATPTSLHKHICPKCKKVWENDAGMDRAWLMRYNSARAGNTRDLALAWLLTGKQVYADKAAEILLDYAAGYPKMPIVGLRSTSGGTRLGANSLHSSYVVPSFAEAWRYLAAAPSLDEAARGRITAFIRQAGVENSRHSVEYNNQEAEHFRAYGSAGLATGCWPLAAEAIYGEFGWHELVEFGYSAEGIAHESGAYHRSVMHAMSAFATLAWDYGANLYTPRFKRVFDGSLTAGLVAASYELPYRVYGDPTYVPTLVGERGGVNETTALFGILGLPETTTMPMTSVHLAGAGYVYLRQGNAADYRELRLNYLKTFDRSERDRLITFLYQNGRQLDASVGRITYSSPRSWWMTATAGHNTIVVDGQDQRDVTAQLLVYTPEPTPLAVVATDPQAPLFDGVAQLRAIAILGESWVVFDHVRADRPCIVDRYQYGQGVPAFAAAKARPTAKLPALPEAGAFTDVEGGPTGKEARVDYPNGLHLRLVSDADFELYRAVTVGGYQADPLAVSFARRAGVKEAQFLAAFTFGADREPPALTLEPPTPNAFAFTVRAKDQAWRVELLPGEKKATVTPQ